MVNAALWMLAVVAAVPKGPADWITPYDYPAAALAENRGGYSNFTLHISAAGKPIRCGITQSSGSNDLDAQTCALMMQRARFESARNSHGDAMPAVYRNRNRWWAGMGSMPKATVPTPDMTLSVQGFPKGIENPTKIAVAFLVDATGAVSDCSGIITGRQPKPGSQRETETLRQIALLAPAACEAVIGGLRPPVFRDETNLAGPSIQTADIAFEVE